jgi:oligo-1,6-glucosidase
MNKLLFPSALLLLFFIILVSCNSAGNKKQEAIKTDSLNRKWWKEAVIYQLYPRSFKDSDGDGVGDLKGIISKLDYIKSLGIDAVWLNPIYASPNTDNGYDISDYRGIMKEFGTMEDFDALVKGMHERGIKVVMDMVLNHSSSEHEWFKQSRSSRDNAYRNYYHWWPAEKGKPVSRFSFFDVNGDAWKYDSLTNAYYLHIFSDKQPDLNWENPKLREEVYSMMQYWLDKGIDGFRMDAFQYASKDTSFPIFPDGYTKDIVKYYTGPHLHEYIQEMATRVLNKKDILTVAEGAGTNPDDAMKFVYPEGKEFSMAYHFEGIDFGLVPGEFKVPDPKGLDIVKLKQLYTKWDSAFAEKGWVSIYLANHDQPRMVSRWGNDASEFRELSSKMLSTFIMTMRGTPYYYYGDELGMSNIKFDKIEDYKDIETINHYQQQKAAGKDLVKFINNQKIMARDNGRTPFQWDTTANAGFTSGKPWLPVNANYTFVNAAAQEKEETSCLNYFRKLTKLRKDNLALVYGKYTLLDAANKNVYAYTRTLDEKRFLIVLNFTAAQAIVNTGIDLSKAKNILSNYPTISNNDKLRPYEAVIYEL